MKTGVFTSFWVALLLCFTAGHSQNLVLNPSLETITACTPDLSVVVDWSNPTGATPDYYNACSPSFMGLGLGVPSNILGWQHAHSGDGYAGIVTYEDAGFFGCPSPLFASGWREYVQVQFSSPLVAGDVYCIQFYLSLANNVKYATEDLGVYFSNTQVAWADSTDLPYTPHVVWTGGAITDTTDWVEFNGSYTAVGGEQYMVIGNYEGDPATTVTCANSASFNGFAYYYVDDVFVGLGACAPPCAMTVEFTSEHKPCGASVANITASPVGGSGSYTYLWSTGGSDATILNAPNGTYTVTVTDDLGCSSIATYTLALPAPPTANAGLDVTVCEGQSVTLSATGGTVYAWNTGASTANISVMPPLTTTYSVTVTNAEGCSDADLVTVNVNDAPNVSIESLDSTYCDKDKGIALSAGPNGGTFSGPGVSGTTFDPSVAGIGSHLIIYSIVGANGCVGADTIEVEVVACTGIAEELFGGVFHVYPNPAGQTVFVEINPGKNLDISLKINDMLGREIYSRNAQASPGKNVFTLEFPPVAKGVYFLNVVAEGRMMGVRVVRE